MGHRNTGLALLAFALPLAVTAGDLVMELEREIGLTRTEYWGGRRRHPAVVHSVTAVPSADCISLAGEWSFTNRTHDSSAYALPDWPEKALWGASAKVMVPGTWEASGIGEPGDSVPHLGSDNSPKRIRHALYGKGCYRKSVEIPSSLIERGQSPS